MAHLGQVPSSRCRLACPAVSPGAVGSHKGHVCARDPSLPAWRGGKSRLCGDGGSERQAPQQELRIAADAWL
ncbi:hypothetical protein CapIbe_019181 [Capra ibex]